MSKILVVDDDKNLLDTIEYNLVSAHYTVIKASDGVQGLELARLEKPDLIILDVMLPGLDGFEVCRILRREMSAPILLLTAKTDETDKVVGLELGADDYVTKPFNLKELMARIRAMLRRGKMKEQVITTHPPETRKPGSLFKGHNIELDTVRHLVTLRGVPIILTRKQFDLLAFLMRNKGQVFNREQLMEKVWGYSFDGSERTVDVHIRWLREKIEDDPKNPKHLRTVHGFGYKYD